MQKLKLPDHSKYDEVKLHRKWARDLKATGKARQRSRSWLKGSGSFRQSVNTRHSLQKRKNPETEARTLSWEKQQGMNNSALLTNICSLTDHNTSSPFFFGCVGQSAHCTVYKYFNAKVHHVQFSCRHLYLVGTLFSKVHVIWDQRKNDIIYFVYFFSVMASMLLETGCSPRPMFSSFFPLLKQIWSAERKRETWLRIKLMMVNVITHKLGDNF